MSNYNRKEHLSRQANEYDKARSNAMNRIYWNCWVMVALWPLYLPGSVLSQSMAGRILACDPARVRAQADRIAELEKELDLK